MTGLMESERTEAENAILAGARSAPFIRAMDVERALRLETDSVYGSAVAMPQVARSTGWSKTYTVLAIKSWILLVTNIALQLILLSMLGEELEVWNGFSGKMSLCDFGKELENCPHSANCMGPGGTTYTPARLYSFDIWTTRTYVRDSLVSMFPDKKDEIMSQVDPGEYGMENFYCRWVCCFLFMMSTVRDAARSFEMLQLLWVIPNEEGAWIKFDESAAKKDADGHVDWLKGVRFQIAGMSRLWKFISFATVFCPKMLLWWCCVSAGFRFLMETSAILDLIMNSMALGFILSIDEMMVENMGTMPIRYIMGNLESYEVFTGQDLHDTETEEEALERFHRDELKTGIMADLALAVNLIPPRLLVSIVMTVGLTCLYYWQHCVHLPDGSWVSKDMYLPTDSKFRFWEYLFETDIPEESTPYFSHN
ncbi:unnamed protein product [Polarella glacialis]|uniref:Uncharacterized protein n=1 Tax=Polarella glacialis TaxID=89957 RepID=A0A813FVK5_POLGL|nr:unnamed protein product [Polarella glacialis]